MQQWIDKHSKIPLYQQVENAILSLLEIEPYCQGAFLPGENTLIKQFGVARQTVRMALQNLVNRGIISRERGRGSRKIVNSNKIHTNITAWSSFSSEMEKQGHQPNLFLIETKIITAPEHICQIFQVKSSTLFAHLSRFYGYQTSSSIDVYFASFFNPNLNLEQDPDFINRRFSRLYNFLQSRYDITPTRSEESIRIGTFPDSISLQNSTQNDESVLLRERLVYDQKDNLIEHNVGYYRASVFEFRVTSTILDLNT